MDMLDGFEVIDREGTENDFLVCPWGHEIALSDADDEDLKRSLARDHLAKRHERALEERE